MSKLEAEIELCNFSQESGIEYVIIRPPMVYGPGAKGNFMKMIGWLRHNIPLPFSLIENRRSFISISNLTDLIVNTIENPRAANCTFLASDGEDVSTPDFMRRASLAMGKNAILFPVSPAILRILLEKSGYPQLTKSLLSSLEIDISYTRDTLQWSPPLRLDTGLQSAVKEFASVY